MGCLHDLVRGHRNHRIRHGRLYLANKLVVALDFVRARAILVRVEGSRTTRTTQAQRERSLGI